MILLLQNSKLPLRMQMEILYFFGTDMQIYEVAIWLKYR